MTLARGLGLAALGFCVAIVAALCGIGGGLFVGPALHYVLRFPLKRAVATTLGLVSAVTASATGFEAVHPEGRIHWPVVGILVASGLVGAQLGFLVSKRLAVRQLKAVFCFVLLFAAARMVLGSHGPEVAAAFELGPAELAGIGAIGLGAGFVAPLLGIGGGLVAVPGLYLGFPALGYLGARACSMALGAVTSCRSLWLFDRVGLVERPAAAWLGLGGLLGAGVGIQLVHLAGAADVAKHLLAGILALVAVRFGIDALRGSAEPSE